MVKRLANGRFAKGKKRRESKVKGKPRTKLTTRLKRLGRKVGRASGRIRSAVGGRL